MKRCPKCEFTFDDYQEFCDFDGAELSVLPDFSASRRTLLPHAAPSPFQRVVRSRVTLAGLSLVAVALSALMIGYYDATNPQDAVNGPDSVPAETVQVDKSSPGPAYVSMERRVVSAKEASEMPSSMIKWLAEDSESRPSQSGATESAFKVSSTRVQANTRRAVMSKQSLADNHRNAFRTSNKAGHRKSDQNAAGARRQKDSRVVAIIKKTGSILTWPFKL